VNTPKITMRAALLVAVPLATLTVGAVVPAFAGSDSPLSSAKKPGTSEVHAQTKYWWLNDEIGRCDTWPDGYSVYANFSYNGVNSSTPQWNGGNGTCNRWDMGTIGGGTTVSQRAAVQVEGGTNWYGSWVSGTA
jgi:hypothetical protein